MFQTRGAKEPANGGEPAKGGAPAKGGEPVMKAPGQASETSPDNAGGAKKKP